LGIWYFLSKEKKVIGREAALSLACGALLGEAASTLATVGESVDRQSFPFLMAATIVLMMGGLRTREGLGGKELQGLAGLLVTVTAAALLVGSFWDRSRLMYVECLRNIQLGFENLPFVTDLEVEEYKKLQGSIPAGRVILTRLDKPFLLDFRRNRVFLMDQAGEASLPPGMPLFQGSEPLASYLIAKSIRYVAYSYGDEVGFTRYFSYMLSPYNNVWGRTIAQSTYDVQDNLTELGKTRKRIYDDGKSFVLDLQQRDR